MNEIAGYVLESSIGAGGSGEVFRARSQKTGEVVAIKRLRAELAMAETARRRFVREAELTRSLVHPSIVGVIEAGLDVRQRPFIVYEWIDGRRLDELAPVSSREARRIGLTLLDAVAYAHVMGIVHRDLSPANVLLQDDGAVRVIDFGLARLLERSLGEAAMTQLSKSGVVIGTPPYLAPEQIEGWTVDARVDLWAVGALLFRLVSGRPVFRAGSPTLVMLKSVSEDAPALDTIVPSIASDFAAVVSRALSRDRDRRWPSAASFAEALTSATVSDGVHTSEGTPEPSVTRSLGES